MSSGEAPHPQGFDAYAEEYDEALQRGLAVSGEDKHFFAVRRVEWLAGILSALRMEPGTIMDFGCGTGTAVPLLLNLPGCRQVIGIDQSEQSLRLACRQQPASRASFHTPAAYAPSGAVDLAFCNGVIHHIPPGERAGALHFVHRALKPGGLFAIWENNPWNPGTRYVMSRIPFDRDAVPIASPALVKLLMREGFEVLRRDYLFIFPRWLRWFRPLEPHVARWPLGAQYLVLGRKPD